MLTICGTSYTHTQTAIQNGINPMSTRNMHNKTMLLYLLPPSTHYHHSTLPLYITCINTTYVLYFTGTGKMCRYVQNTHTHYKNNPYKEKIARHASLHTHPHVQKQ